MSPIGQRIILDTFTDWARAQRQIYICDGISPGMIGEVGEGSGIFARRAIEAGERLVYIPASALLTTDTVIAFYRRNIGKGGSSEPKISNLPPLNCSAHALLAAYLTRTRNDPELRSWRATWPQEGDLNTLPVEWTKDLKIMLPGEAVSLVDRQKRRIQDDWDITREWVFRGMKEIDEERLRSSFEYYWLIINTRTFYWPHAESFTKLQEAFEALKAANNTTACQDSDSDPKGSETAMEWRTATDKLEPKRASEECLALCPWADLFNHTDEEFASATFDENGYTVTALRAYEKDEEIFVNYGAHGNDYLLAEYGFILPSNNDDFYNLDTIILPNLSHEQEEVLHESGYYGNYNLSPEPPYLCFRTHAMLRLLALCGEDDHHHEEANKFQNYYAFINTALSGTASERLKVAQKALELILEPLNEKCGHMIDVLGEGGPQQQQQKEMLRNRWIQISEMVTTGAMRAAMREIEINTVELEAEFEAESNESNENGENSTGLF